MEKHGDLHFERRIPLGAEPVEAERLVEGSVYFAVRYLDKDLVVPTMDTLVFMGRDLEADDVGLLYFQHASAYEMGYEYRQGDKSRGLGIQLYLESSANNVFEYEKALDELMRCSIRRKGTDGPHL
jgi:hypothetical protein